MADWSLPVPGTGYLDTLTYLKNRDVDAATLGYSGDPTNAPNGFFVYDRTNNKFQQIVSSSKTDVILSIAGGGTGANSASSARSNLGLLSMATQAANAVAITGGTIVGITQVGIIDSVFPSIYIRNTTAAVDTKTWDLSVNSSGSLLLRAVNEGYSAANIGIRFNRTGYVPTSIELLNSSGVMYTKFEDGVRQLLLQRSGDVGITLNCTGGSGRVIALTSATDGTFRIQHDTDGIPRIQFNGDEILLYSNASLGFSLDANGYITGPQQPCFNVVCNSAAILSAGIWTQITSFTEVFDVSNSFASNQFIVPKTGKYRFSAGFSINLSAGFFPVNLIGQLRLRNLTTASFYWLDYRTYYMNNVGFMSLGNSILLSLTQGDVIIIEINSSLAANIAITNTTNFFCGELIS